MKSKVFCTNWEVITRDDTADSVSVINRSDGSGVFSVRISSGNAMSIFVFNLISYLSKYK